MATTPDVQIGWQDYLAVGLRRRQFFLVPLGVVMAVALLIVLFAPRIYEAEALIAVQSEKLINPLIQGLAMPTDIRDRLSTLREEILSFSNLSRLIETHHLDRDLPPHNPVAYERLVQQLREMIYVKMRGDKLIEVSYQGRDPAEVQRMVNSLTDIVIERDSAIQEEEANSAVSFIEAELAVYRQKLEESEKKLREFKELYMTQMPVATALNQRLKDLELQLTTLLIDNTEEHPIVIEVKRQIAEVRRQRDEEIQRLVAHGVLQDRGDPAMYEELLNQLATRTPAAQANPTVLRAQEGVAALVEGLEKPEIPVSTGPQVAVTPQGTMIQLNDAAATSLTLAPREQQELVRLTRDYSVNENIYRGLLEKLERAKITGRLGEDKEGGKFRILEHARLPLKPIQPNPMQVFLIALVIGLALGFCSVVVAEYLDQSIQTAEEAAELLDLPVLGAIPTIVTETDLVERRRRRKGWISIRQHQQRLKTRIITPLWTRVDRALVRLGL